MSSHNGKNGHDAFDVRHMSRNILDGVERAGARAMLKGIGLSDEDLQKRVGQRELIEEHAGVDDDEADRDERNRARRDDVAEREHRRSIPARGRQPDLTASETLLVRDGILDCHGASHRL